MKERREINLAIFGILIFIILLFFNSVFAQEIPFEEGQVYVCPLAKRMEEINPKCECRIDLTLGEKVIGNCGTSTYEMILTIQEYEGQLYYAIYGFENGGAGLNSPPQAKISGNSEGFVGEKILLSAINSFDPNNDPLDFFWDFGDGQINKDKDVFHIYSSPGEYNVSLTVSDGLASSTATTTVIVKPRPILENLSVSQTINISEETDLPTESLDKENKEKENISLNKDQLNQNEEKTKFLFPKIIKGVKEEIKDTNKENKIEEIKKETEKIQDKTEKELRIFKFLKISILSLLMVLFFLIFIKSKVFLKIKK